MSLTLGRMEASHKRTALGDKKMNIYIDNHQRQKKIDKAAKFIRQHFAALTAAVFLINLVFFAAFDQAVFHKGCEELYDGVLRLHILANSDSKEDQQLKLKVRDRVLSTAKELGLGKGCKDMQDTIEQSKQLLPQLIEAAQDELIKNESNQTVDACITKMYFNTREYEGFTMPAGEYHAVRFTIGKGEGKNWWCVLFPQMCLPVAFEEPLEQEMFSHAQLRVLTSRPKYEPRFALLELVHKIGL